MVDRIWLKHYPTGIPAEIDADHFSSIPDLLDKIVIRFADKPAYHNLGYTMSYAALERLSRDFAAFLQGLPGMAKGERVAIMLPILLQYPVAQHNCPLGQDRRRRWPRRSEVPRRRRGSVEPQGATTAYGEVHCLGF